MRGDHWRKPTNDRDSKPEKYSDAAFGTSFRILFLSVFIEASKILFNIFFIRPTKRVKKRLAYVGKAPSWFYRSVKIIGAFEIYVSNDTATEKGRT
jgi:hypothetical protein